MTNTEVFALVRNELPESEDIELVREPSWSPIATRDRAESGLNSRFLVRMTPMSARRSCFYVSRMLISESYLELAIITKVLAASRSFMWTISARVGMA